MFSQALNFFERLCLQGRAAGELFHSKHCVSFLSIRLYVHAGGFAQGDNLGLDRVRTTEPWPQVLFGLTTPGIPGLQYVTWQCLECDKVSVNKG